MNHKLVDRPHRDKQRELMRCIWSVCSIRSGLLWHTHMRPVEGNRQYVERLTCSVAYYWNISVLSYNDSFGQRKQVSFAVITQIEN